MNTFSWFLLGFSLAELALIVWFIFRRAADLDWMDEEIRKRTSYKEADFLRYQEMVQNEREKIEQDLLRKLEQNNQAHFIAPCDGEFWLDEHFVKLKRGESYTYQWRPNHAPK